MEADPATAVLAPLVLAAPAPTGSPVVKVAGPHAYFWLVADQAKLKPVPAASPEVLARATAKRERRKARREAEAAGAAVDDGGSSGRSSGWFGGGTGSVVGVIVCMLLVRGCAALMKSSNSPPALAPAPSQLSVTPDEVMKAQLKLVPFTAEEIQRFQKYEQDRVAAPGTPKPPRYEEWRYVGSPTTPTVSDRRPSPDTRR